MTKKAVSIKDAINVVSPPAATPGNFAALVFPTDVWGLTADLKAASRHIAGRICGSKDKYDLVQATLKLLIQHIDTRYNEDRAQIAKSNTP